MHARASGRLGIFKVGCGVGLAFEGKEWDDVKTFVSCFVALFV